MMHLLVSTGTQFYCCNDSASVVVRAYDRLKIGILQFSVTICVVKYALSFINDDFAITVVTVTVTTTSSSSSSSSQWYTHHLPAAAAAAVVTLNSYH